MEVIVSAKCYLRSLLVTAATRLFSLRRTHQETTSIHSSPAHRPPWTIMSDSQLAIVNDPPREGQLLGEHIDRRLRAYLSRQIDIVDGTSTDVPATDIHSIPDLVRAPDQLERITENLAAISATRGRLVRSLLVQTSGQEQVLAELRTELAERDGTLAELQGGLTERDRALTELRTGLARRDGALAELHAGLAERDRVLTELRTELAERDGALAELRTGLAQRDGALTELQVGLAERDRAITELRTGLAQRDGALTDLRAEIGSLTEKITPQAKRANLSLSQSRITVPTDHVGTAVIQGSSMPLRIAVVPTPRSGNVWLRSLLSHIYRIPAIAVHTVSDIDWNRLPAECVLAIHWHRTPELVAQLESHGFRALALARHPLDVLISILQFALRDASTERWLDGEGGNERSIYGAMPRSTAFLEYARGPRASALLSVTPQWWKAPGSYHVRYEELVASTHTTLENLADEIGVHVRESIVSAVEATSIPRLRASTGDTHHFWQGMPGLWRQLLPAAEANEIAAAHSPIMNELGYRIDPDPHLDGNRADSHWIELVGQELAAELRSLPSTRQAVTVAQARIEEITAKLSPYERALDKG